LLCYLQTLANITKDDSRYNEFLEHAKIVMPTCPGQLQPHPNLECGKLISPLGALPPQGFLPRYLPLMGALVWVFKRQLPTFFVHKQWGTVFVVSAAGSMLQMEYF
jgi:hypothetical protein